MTIHEQLILITAISFFALMIVAFIVMMRQLVRAINDRRDARIANAVMNIRTTRTIDLPADVVDDIARVIADDHIIEALRLHMPLEADARDTLDDIMIRMFEAMRDEAQRDDNA